MKLADDPTPADPLGPLTADLDDEARRMVVRLLRLASVHDNATLRAASHDPQQHPELPSSSTSERSPCP